MSFKKKTLVGIFLLGGVLLFGVGLFMIGSRRQLFASHFHVYTDFTNLDTITPGAKVRVSGMDAGQVTAIDVPKNPNERFRLTLEVDDKFHPIVREDSVATIETEGMVGNKFVDIKQGSANSPECPPHGTLPSEEPFNMGALMKQGGGLVKQVQSTISDIQKRADKAIDNITSLSGHVDGVVVSVRGDIKQMTSNGAHITRDVNEIASNIRKGNGAAGKILMDKTVASDVEDTVAKARQSSANVEQATQKVNTMISEVQQKDMPNVRQTLDNTRNMTGQMNQAVGTFLSPGSGGENTAVALRDTVHGAKQTASNLADDTEAIKHNFFFRGFFNRRGFYNLDQITPSKYNSSQFVKKPKARVWLTSAGLFTTKPDGTQELTDTGRSILNQSMSDLVPYLPNNPLVIEGYAANGMPDRRYLASRQRAVEVRRYLESHFHLNPKLVGVMPMADQPPRGAGKKMWDGICLVLVVSK
jgi:phospholipid/cholesterol/gamma-HCH transport system substrate-binding protein